MSDIGMNQECVNRLASMKNPIIVPSYKHPLPENPFAKGVSINQDMLTEEWQDAIDNGRVTLVTHDPNNLDRYSADLYASHPTLEEDLRKCFTKRGDDRRQLLALGREEE